MTVCIATLFEWNYAKIGDPPDWGIAAITASDRLITFVDVEYEPNQQKVAFFDGFMILVAGDMAIHSQALQETGRTTQNKKPSAHDVALIYGRAIQGINSRHAENEILAPLGLNSDTFHAQQKDFSETFVHNIMVQLQNRRPSDVEALIVGSDGRVVQIYTVDSKGTDYCMDDVGFAAIGAGAWHAKSKLMQVGHVKTRKFANALATVIASKKIAELAPGVGSKTDMNIVFREAIIPVWPNILTEAHTLFDKFQARASALGDEMVAELSAFLSVPPKEDELTDDEGLRANKENSEAEGSDIENAPK